MGINHPFCHWKITLLNEEECGTAQNVVLVLYLLFQSCSLKEKQSNPHLFKYSVQLVVQALDEDIGRNNSIISNLMSFCNNSRHPMQTAHRTIYNHQTRWHLTLWPQSNWIHFLLLVSKFHALSVVFVVQFTALITQPAIADKNRNRFSSNRIYLNRRIPSISTFFLYITKSYLLTYNGYVFFLFSGKSIIYFTSLFLKHVDGFME